MKTRIHLITLCGFFAAAFFPRMGNAGEAAKPGVSDPNDPAIQAIRKAGEPVTLAELNRWYVAPQPEQNAAPLYAAAFAALTVTNATLPSFVPQNQRAVSLLHQAATRSRCRYEIDLTRGNFVQLPHLAKINLCGQLLQQNASAVAANGRTDIAARSITSALTLARSLEQEPILISQLVRIAVIARTTDGLEQSLNAKTFSEAEATELMAALQAAEQAHIAAFVRGLAGERCMMLEVFDSPTQLTALMRSATPAPGQKPSAEESAIEQMFQNYRGTAGWQEDRGFYLSHLGALITGAKSSFPTGLQILAQWREELDGAKQRNLYISAMVLPAVAKAQERGATTIALLRIARSGLAIERYRLAQNNQLPDTLDQLVPQYLSAVPVDPYDGAPVRYKKNSSAGYTVYCVGIDLKDNGGTPRPGTAQTGMKYDLTFVVRR